MDDNSNIKGIDGALEFCSERLAHHQKKDQLYFMTSLMSLVFGVMIIFQSYMVGRGSEDTSSNLTLAAFCVVTFGVLMALHRYHLTEISKYEYYKLAFARLNIAQSYNEKSTDAIISSLTFDAFNFKGSNNAVGTVQSPLPGHFTSDLSALLVSKLIDNTKASDKKANK